MRDRVGLGWRGELAAGILAHLDRIDVVEVIADDYFGAPRRSLRAMRTLASQVRVVLHGVGLGLASTEPVERKRLDNMARVVHAVEPVFWSEHLAFVRGGGREIGHLAAPPRNLATRDGAVRNLEEATAVVGTPPLVENVATLIDPPGSDCDEASWIAGVLHETRSDLLLDLHNLYANATNFGFDPEAFLTRIPMDRVRAVHLAGGRFVAEPAQKGRPRRLRLLDDHLHDAPDPVYNLLFETARRCSQPLTVILERDGAYPGMAELIAQLDRAREALRLGREQQLRSDAPWATCPAPHASGDGEAIDLAFLTRLYVDEGTRARFLADPRGEAIRAGFDPHACEALAGIDRAGLELAARSFEKKRAARAFR